MIVARLLPIASVLLTCSVLAACSSDSTPGTADGGSSEGGSTSTDPGELGSSPEDSSGTSLIAPHAGTWNVTATSGTHARGTIIIKANGDIDFDTGKAFTASEYEGVYDRRTVTDSEGGGRIQVEILPTGSTPQQRIRIFVDGSNARPKSITYYPDANANDPKVAVTVN
jgi:hypothetical protein